MKSIYIFILIIFVFIIYNIFNIKKNIEQFSNYNLEGAYGIYPLATDSLLVQNSYPLTNNTQISNNTSSNIWWHYPIFKLGSYAQITNNIKYPNNPDEGTCMPASMCQTLYQEKQLKNNYVYALPPVENGIRRINYYNTDINLLPFTNNKNILY